MYLFYTVFPTIFSPLASFSTHCLAGAADFVLGNQAVPQKCREPDPGLWEQAVGKSSTELIHGHTCILRLYLLVISPGDCAEDALPELLMPGPAATPAGKALPNALHVFMVLQREETENKEEK